MTATLAEATGRAVAAKSARRLPGRPVVGGRVAAAGWLTASVLTFAGIWELAWLTGLAPELLLPPPHIFLSDLGRQAGYFEGAAFAGKDQAPVVAVASTVLATMARVCVGLLLGLVLSLITGVALNYFRVLGKLTIPTLTLLAPISPVAWLPVAVFLFGVGDAPAVFMVFVGVYFVMTLATLTEISNVQKTSLDVSRTLGASRRQVMATVILPTILPGLLNTLRMNLFAAWMIVLIAEAVGVGSGLGQTIMLARNTFNSTLVFFTMVLIGVSGYLLDQVLRMIQRRILWWTPDSRGGRSR